MARVPLRVLFLLGLLATILIGGDAHDQPAPAAGDKSHETCPANDPNAPGCKGGAGGAAAPGAAPGGGAGGTFDISKYGGKPNSDIAKPLMDAWAAACAATSPSKVVVPKGDYSLGVTLLKGPCKAPIELQMDGSFKAPAKCAEMKDLDGKPADYWVKLQYVDGLKFSGTGAFDGNGQDGWDHNKVGGKKEGNFPYNFRFDFLKNSEISGIHCMNSKLFQMAVFSCVNVTLKDLEITAPADSHNTDGMHIAKSTGVSVIGCKIGTGDDCVSVGDGTKNLLVDSVTCGPGHGLSIGSLGKMEGEEPVVGVTVKNCTLENTDNGVRVKTWLGSCAKNMAVSDLHFEDITLKNVSNPIIIDQAYCAGADCKGAKPSTVKISDVTFKNVKGTSATPVAISLVCSSSCPCDKIQLDNVDICHEGKEGPATSECINVKPVITGTVNPKPCTKVFEHPQGYKV